MTFSTDAPSGKGRELFMENRRLTAEITALAARVAELEAQIELCAGYLSIYDTAMLAEYWTKYSSPVIEAEKERRIKAAVQKMFVNGAGLPDADGAGHG